MAKQGENLNVTCPCCQAKLVIDPVFGAVLSHEAHVRPGPGVDLTKASDILEEQKRQREDKFADSFFQETHKEDILAKKFEEAMKKAKDAPPESRFGISTSINWQKALFVFSFHKIHIMDLTSSRFPSNLSRFSIQRIVLSHMRRFYSQLVCNSLCCCHPCESACGG